MLCYNKWCILCEEMQCTDHFILATIITSISYKQNDIFLYSHFHHFDLLFVLKLISHFVLTNSFVYILLSTMLYEKIHLSSLSATIITCIIYYQSLIKFIYSCHFHNFDLLSVLIKLLCRFCSVHCHYTKQSVHSPSDLQVYYCVQNAIGDRNIVKLGGLTDTLLDYSFL